MISTVLNSQELRRIFIADTFELQKVSIFNTRVNDHSPILLLIGNVKGWKRGVLERVIEREALLETQLLETSRPPQS